MSKTIVKECSKHGITDHVLEKNGYYRCKKCRSSYVLKRRREAKLILVEEFGGKCLVCGYNKCITNLVFHHKDPTQKDFGLSHGGVTPSIEKLRKEAKKCVLLCCRCHGEVHAGIITI